MALSGSFMGVPRFQGVSVSGGSGVFQGVLGAFQGIPGGHRGI